MTPPEISLVVCTRDRAPQLERTLASLKQIRDDSPAWELVVVDNGSSDDTAAVLEEFARSFGGALHLVREERPGLARARNTGLARASGSVVAFTDDDCYPAPDWLCRIGECFAAEPSLGFLGGRILLHDPEDRPMTILVAEERQDFPAGSFLEPGAVQGANLAFRRAALAGIGGFDVRLGAGTAFACEDLDAAARVSAAGWAGAYDPRPVVYHHHGRKTDEVVRALLRSYHHGAGAYYARCLMNPRLRARYGRRWVRSWFAAPRRALREMKGAMHYCLDSLTGRR